MSQFFRNIYPSLILAAILAGTLAAGGDYVTANFATYFLTQIGSVVLGSVIGLPHRCVLGLGLGASGYLLAYYLWVVTGSPVESMAWIGYAISMPAMAVAIIGLRMALGRCKSNEFAPRNSGMLATGVFTAFVGALMPLVALRMAQLL